MNRLFARALVAAVTLSAFALPAFAHATLEMKEAKVGASYKAVLKVPHGCEGQATHTVKVHIPEGYFAVKPMPKAGWNLEVKTGKYAKAYMNHGTEVTEGVLEIVWSGGNLPDAFYDEFVFTGTFAPDLPSDQKFYFSAIQVCDTGENAWIDTSGDPAAAKPAPSLTLKPADAPAH